MSKKLAPIAAALGTAFAVSVASTSVSAAANPFSMTDLGNGYSVAMGDKPAEGKCGEGKCGEGKKAASEAKCGAKKPEGKCGEGKCGADKAKKATEGKCGEAKCGAKK